MNPKIQLKTEEAQKYSNQWPNVIYVSRGEGMEMTGIIVSVHKDYRDYIQKLTIFRRDWAEYIEELQSFITVVGEGTHIRYTYVSVSLSHSHTPNTEEHQSHKTPNPLPSKTKQTE